MTRATYTNLDVLQEKRIDDDWNVDVDRSLTDSWTGFTKFNRTKNFPKDICGPRERLTKIQATTRLDCLWPETWTGMSKAAREKERQEWATEEPKLDNARKPRAFTSLIRKRRA